MKVVELRNELNKLLSNFDPEIEIFLYNTDKERIVEPNIFIQTHPSSPSGVRFFIIKGSEHFLGSD